jgi:hypothetical protein
MQSILRAPDRGYAAGHQSDRGSPEASTITDSTQNVHEVVLERRQLRSNPVPAVPKQIIAGAKQSFVDGQDWAYLAGIIAILVGATLVFTSSRSSIATSFATYRRRPRVPATAQQGTPEPARHPRRRPNSPPRQPTFYRWTGHRRSDSRPDG